MMQKTSLGLDERVERVLTYSLFWISGLFFFLLEKNPNVRRHAIQSMVTFGALSIIIFGVGMLDNMLAWIPLLNLITTFGLGLLQRMLWFVWFILWIWLMVMAFTRTNYRLPIVNAILRALF
ncbi:MAG TPA: hypothetical protein VL461_07950 [Dictyobacter sp.]|jgi:uncharacterized membrane protein|nr:hypothetical protein [Dictyobacter sp.]